MDGRLDVIIYGLLVAALTIPVAALAATIRGALGLPRIMYFGVTLAILGVAAEVVFFLTMTSTFVTQIAIRLVAIAGTGSTMARLRRPAFRKELSDADTWAPFAVTFAVGLSFMSLMVISLPPATPTLAFAQQWPMTLPDDNVLPHILAQHIAQHAPPKPFVGSWLSSDRPPLQAGFDLLFAALVPFAKDDEVRYQALAMLLAATSLGAMFTLCRVVGCTMFRAGIVVFLTAMTGFVFVNTVFVWPKLMAAAFALVAICTYLAMRGRIGIAGVVIGTEMSLSLLAHASVVFTLPALFVVACVQRRRDAAKLLSCAAMAMVVLTAPWTWYQRVYDPPADRLLKWHLAGQIDVTSAGFMPTLYHAYADVPLRTIVENKVENVETLFGTTLGELPQRSREFFYVGEALGVLWIPFIAALGFIRSRRSTLRIASQFAWISAASLVFWALVMYLPKATVVHVGSDTTMFLMAAAGALVATEWLVPATVLAVWQVAHFAIVWLAVVDVAYLRTLAGAAAALIIATITATCCALAIRPLVRRIARIPSLSLFHRWGSSRALLAGVVLTPFAAATAFFLAAPTPSSAAGAAAIARSDAMLPPLNAMKLEPAPPVLSMDVISINGDQQIVAALRHERIVRVRPTDTIAFSGWAFDPLAATSAAGVEALVGSRVVSLQYGIARPDVAAAYRRASLAPVGFSGRISAQILPRSATPLTIIVITPDRKAYYLQRTRITLRRTM